MPSFAVEGIEWTGRLGGMTPAGQVFRSGNNATFELDRERLILRNGNQRLFTITSDSIPSLPLGSKCVCDSITFSLPSNLATTFFSSSSTTASAPPLAALPPDLFPLACNAVVRRHHSSLPRPATVLISSTSVRIVESNGQQLAQLNAKSAARLFSGGVQIGAEYNLGTLNIQLVPPPPTPIRLSPGFEARSPLAPTTPRATPASSKRRRSPASPPDRESPAKRTAGAPDARADSPAAAVLAQASTPAPLHARDSPNTGAEAPVRAQGGTSTGTSVAANEREEAWRQKESKWEHVMDEMRKERRERDTARELRERVWREGPSASAEDFLAVINGRRAERARPPPPLSLRHPAYAAVVSAPATFAVLQQLARDPLCPLPRRSSALSSPLSETSDHPRQGHFAQYYIRSVAFSSALDASVALAAYRRLYPADAIWADALRAHVAQRSTAVSIPYGGMTIASDAAGRAAQDEGETGRRFPNFCSAAAAAGVSAAVEVRELVELAQPVSSALSANAAAIGELEAIVISSLGPLSLNSAPGGRLLALDSNALALERQLVERAGAAHANLDALAPLAPPPQSVLDKLSQHMDDSLSFWRDCPDSGYVLDETKAGGASAKQSILSDLGGGGVRGHAENGVFEVLLSKDVPRVGLEGRETMTGSTAARGPAARALIDGLLHGCTTVNLRQYTACLDLWAVQLRHKLVIIAIIFCARALIILRPALLVSRSSKISNLLRTGRFASAFRHDSLDLAPFLSLSIFSSKVVLESVSISTDLVWSETESPEWIQLVGTTAVVRYGPLPEHVALHIATLDEGRIKYDPALQDEHVALEAAALAKVALARRVVIQALLDEPERRMPKDGPALHALLRKVREQVEEEARSSGIEDALHAARNRCALRTAALTGLRDLGSSKRAEAIRLTGGATLDELAAERSEARRAQLAAQPAKPAFDTPALSLAIITSLALPFHPSSPRSTAVLNIVNIPTATVATYPRLAQLVSLLGDHNEALLDGIPSPLPPVHGCTIGEEQYCSWYLSAREGVEIARSAGGVNRGKGGPVKDPIRAEELRGMRVSDALEREEAQRAVRGVSLPGSKSAGEMLALFETADREGTGYGARRDLLAHRCSSCEGLHFAYRNKLDSAPHDAACSGRLESVHVLHPSTLLFLADEPVNALKVLEPAVNSEITSIRQMVTHSDDMGKLALLGLAKLEFVSIDTKISVLALDSGVWRGLAALDLILVAQAPDSIKSDDYAWGGNSGASSATTISAILDSDNLVIFNCPEEGCDYVTVIGSRHSSTPQHRHDSRRPYMVLAASQLAAGDSILDLPLQRARRLLFALASPNDQGIKSIVDKRAGKKASTKDREAALEDIRGVVFAWRQRRVGGG